MNKCSMIWTQNLYLSHFLLFKKEEIKLNLYLYQKVISLDYMLAVNCQWWSVIMEHIQFSIGYFFHNRNWGHLDDGTGKMCPGQAIKYRKMCCSFLCYALKIIALILITPCGLVTHTCIGNLTIVGSNNGLSPGWCQAIIWTNAGILLIETLGKKKSVKF